MTASSEQQRDGIQAEAIEWFAVMGSDKLTLGDKNRFHSWLQQPEHRQAYERINTQWRNLGDFAHSAVLEDTVNETRLRTMTKSDKKHESKRRWFYPLTAVAATLMIGIWATLQWYPAGAVHQTGIGEQKTVMLEDGSTLILNTNTLLRVEFRFSECNIYLERGEANFAVAHNKQRPFTVFAGGGIVKATGTNFDVRLFNPSKVVVTLMEGGVEVVEKDNSVTLAGVRLEPGQQVTYGSSGISAVKSVNLEETSAWQQRKLIFRDRPLVEAVEEVNRYTQQKVEIGDDALKELRVSGIFRAGSSDTLIQALQQYFSIRVVRSKSGNVVLLPMWDQGGQ